MSPTDILDVNGSTYTYLINGQPPAANWTALFRPGERVRLRFINGSAMSIFDVRIPDLPMTVVQADGIDVRPVTVDQFRIGTAETYDVIVQPREDRAFTIFVQAEDRSGFARATLAPRAGMAAPDSAARSAADAHHGRYGHGARRPWRHASTALAASHGAGPCQSIDAAAAARTAITALAVRLSMGNGAHAGHGGAAVNAAPSAHAQHGAMPAASAGTSAHAGHGAAAASNSYPPPTYLEGQVGVDNVAMNTMLTRR